MKSAVSTFVLLSVAFAAEALVPPGLFLLHRATEMPHHISPSTRIAELSLAMSLVLAVLTLASVFRGLHQWWEARRNLGSLPLTEAEVAKVPVLIFSAPDPLAFASGFVRPRIYISTGAQQQLSPGQIHAAVLHERAHVELGIHARHWSLPSHAPPSGGFPYSVSSLTANRRVSNCEPM